MTPAQPAPLGSLRARLRRSPAAPTTIVSPPLPAPLPESDYRRAERLTGPRARHPWTADSLDPWAQAAEASPPATESRPAAAGGRGSLPTLHGVLSPHVGRGLSDLARVVPVVPGAPRSTRHRDPADGDLMVIERAALFGGVWSGTETARGTALLHELLARIEDARGAGLRTVLVESPHHPNVGTNLVRDAVDLVVSRDGSVVGDGPHLSAVHRDLVTAVVRAAHPATTEELREPG